MAKFRGRKKRVALAMGLASLLGASKMASAAGNKAGKAIGITMGGLGVVGVLYETLADTWGRDKKMPSALKAFGVIKNKEDGQIPISPELRKKIDDTLKNQGQKGGNEDEVDSKKMSGNDKFEIIENVDKDDDKLKAIEGFVIIDDDKQKNGSDVGAKNNEFGILKNALGNDYGMSKVMRSGLEKYRAISALADLANGLGLLPDNYKNLTTGRNQFLVDVAHKIGLQGVSDGSMLYICSHNYADVSKAVNGRSNLTKEQKDMLLALCRLRNMIAYDCGAGAASKMKLLANKGENRPGGLPENFFGVKLTKPSHRK